jgi:hypothetical protein
MQAVVIRISCARMEVYNINFAMDLRQFLTSIN